MKMTDEMGETSASSFPVCGKKMYAPCQKTLLVLGRKPTVSSFSKKSYSTTMDWFQSELPIRL